MRKFIIPLIALPLLGGCLGTTDAMKILDEASDTAGKVSEETLNAAAKSIDGYCAAVPGQYREKMRDSINAKTDKGDIMIVCEGD